MTSVLSIKNTVKHRLHVCHVGERHGASEGGELSIRGIDQAVTHHTGHDTPTRGLGPLT